MSIQGRKIQGRGSKKSDLEGTADKVRVIKQRQSQWMKEREEAKGTKTLSSAKSMESIGERSKRSSFRSLSSDIDFEPPSNRNTCRENPYSNPRRKPLYTAPKRDHSNIISWSSKGDSLGKDKRPPSAQSKKNLTSKAALENSSRSTGSVKDKKYEPSNYRSSTKILDDHLRDPYSPTSYSKLEPISKDYSNISDDTGNGPDADDHKGLSPLRSEMNNSHPKLINERKAVGSAFSHESLNQDMINVLAETVAKRLKTTIRDNKENGLKDCNTVEGDHNEEMSTHLCPVCNSLMSGKRHTPMALIPCGHTLCQSCLRDCKNCPTCQSRVSSSAVNTVLQHIIADFMAQKERKRLEKMEKETRKYVDEYQSLSLRSNALAEEADTILNGMEDLTEKLFQEKKIVKRLEVDNENLAKKIHELQNQLEKNKNRMNESQERCENLERDYDEEKQRLALVEDTIKTIRQSKDRVKILVHNFAPSLNLDQFD